MSEKKTGYPKARNLGKKILEKHNISCNMIEHEVKKPHMTLPKSKHKTRWSGGTCTICNEYMDCITHFHAAKHGFNSAEELIEAGYIKFD